MYILTVDLLPRLLNATSQVKPIYLEDVYVTGKPMNFESTSPVRLSMRNQINFGVLLVGLLRERVGADLVYLNELVKYRYVFVPTHCLSLSSFSHHKISANEQKEIFEHYASATDHNTSAFCFLFAYFL